METKQMSIQWKMLQQEELTDIERKLIEKSVEQLSNAYAPYSGYKVGAAVLLANGEIIGGSNQENAVYPAGICAERVALFYAAATYPEVPVLAIAIVSSNKNKLVTPCGICRQVLIEIESRYQQHIKIMMPVENKVYVFEKAVDLLPFAFSKNNLD